MRRNDVERQIDTRSTINSKYGMSDIDGCATSETSDTPGVDLGKGRAARTVALQSFDYLAWKKQFRQTQKRYLADS